MSTPALFPLAPANALSRRAFLLASASFAAAAICSTRAAGVIARTPVFRAYPFSLGVASGDPSADGVVLWTRLAPEPLTDGGGMASEPVEVDWQVAEDEAMTRVVRRGTAVANPEWAHAVHVEVAGLRPDRWYWYRFRAGREESAVGRTRTLPEAGTLPERLRFAFVSCQKYESGYYTALEHLAREDLDLAVHLGDYIYEKPAKQNTARPHGLPLAETLDTYRARYALYKSDPALQAVHAAVPWVVTWDDHEVSNNYANDISEHPEQTTPEAFLRRRAAAYQAYFEHMPLRRSALPHGPDMLLYRRIEYGRLASFHVLDTRQYRTDQPQGDGVKPPDPVLMDPKGTLMGDRQREWFFEGLEKSPATWNVVAQQVMMARVDFRAGSEEGYSMDKWPGYEFERRRVLRHFRDRAIRNPVVITGDIHNNWANELLADFDAPDGPPVAVEFVGTSVSSGGDGVNVPAWAEAARRENPFVKFVNDERGYVRCEVTPGQWRADYRTVEQISRPGAPVNTRATFVVEAGRPGLERA